MERDAERVGGPDTSGEGVPPGRPRPAALPEVPLPDDVPPPSAAAPSLEPDGLPGPPRAPTWLAPPGAESPEPAEPRPALPTGIGAVLGAALDLYMAVYVQVILVAVAYAVVSAGLVAWGLTVLDLVAGPFALGLIIRIAGSQARGQPEAIGQAARGAARTILPLLAWSILIGIAVGGLFVLAWLPILGGVVAWTLEPTAGVLAVPLVFGALAVLVVVGGILLLARWALAPPIIVLDGQGPLAGSSRSANLVRGRTRSVAVLVVVGSAAGLVGSLAGVAAPAVGELADVARVVAIGSQALVLPTMPILFTVLLTRLDRTATDIPRASAARSGLVVGLLGLTLAVGVGLTAIGVGRVLGEVRAFETTRGTVTFGSGGGECRVEGAATRFVVGDTLQVAAVLSRTLDAGETVTARVFLDEVLINEDSSSFDEAADCVYGTISTAGMPTGRYRFEYTIGDEMLATGEVELVAP